MKNFKLLLASTAILSTGALMANADFNSAPISAGVFFAYPSVATQGDMINFGFLEPMNGTNLTVNPDGTFNGSAKVIENGGINGQIHSGSIKFSGGTLLRAAGDAYSLDTETNTYTHNLNGNSLYSSDTDQFLVKLALDDARIDMYADNYENYGEGKHSSRPSCGYVDNLTQGNASWDGTYYTLRIGGTLHLDLDDNYDTAHEGDFFCSGKTTVTYVLQEWF